jgi:hypothetical protein
MRYNLGLITNIWHTPNSWSSHQIWEYPIILMVIKRTQNPHELHGILRIFSTSVRWETIPWSASAACNALLLLLSSVKNCSEFLANSEDPTCSNSGSPRDPMPSLSSPRRLSEPRRLASCEFQAPWDKPNPHATGPLEIYVNDSNTGDTF